jgi:hypothetical protein
VNALLIDLDVARLSPGLFEERLRAQGFEHIEHAEVIPGITRSLTAVKRRTDYEVDAPADFIHRPRASG